MKRLLISCILSFIAVLAFSQVVHDPNDPLYADLEHWKNAGLIESLPPLRPYPSQVVIPLLKKVARTADAAERERARYYLQAIDGRLDFTALAAHDSRFTAGRYEGETGGGALAQGFLTPSVSTSLRVNVWAIDREEGRVIPHYGRVEKDTLTDWASVPLFGKTYSVFQGVTSSIAFGSGNAYFTAGLERSSFGPFFDSGGILSPSAPHAGRFSFVWRNPSFTYTALLLELVATTDSGERKFPDKHLFMHGVEGSPLPWLKLGAFETVVWGGRFDLMYLLPVAELYYTQSLAGFRDNSLFGLTLEAGPLRNLDFGFTFYADDLHFNDLARLNFDTKWKISMQYGLSWTPLEPWLRSLSFTHLLVMPYMYTHIDTSAANDANYQNYTQMGVNLGADIPPNSDRMTLRYRLQPVRRLDLSLEGTLIRHGNASVGFVTGGDGSLFDPGYEDGRPTFQGHTRFLEQDVIEKTYRLSLQGGWLLFPFERGSLRATAGYTLEHVVNRDLEEGRDETNNYFSVGLSLMY